MVDVMDGDDHGGAFADSVAADDVVLDTLARNNPHRGEVPLRFLQAAAG
jgi:hypothetical protein